MLVYHSTPSQGRVIQLFRVHFISMHQTQYMCVSFGGVALLMNVTCRAGLFSILCAAAVKSVFRLGA